MRIKTLLFIVVILFFSNCLQAQNNLLDSLQKRILQSPVDSTIITWYYQKANYFSTEGNKDSLKYFTNKLHEFAMEKKEAVAFALYFHLLTFEQVENKQYDSAVYFSGIGYEWAIKSKKAFNIATALNAMGNAFIYLGNEDSGVIKFLKALPFAQQSGNTKLRINVMYNLSAAYNLIGNFEPAKDAAMKAYSLAGSINDSVSVVKSLFNWATMEVNNGNLDTALIMFKSIVKNAKRNNDKYTVMDGLNNLGEIYYQKGDYNTSLKQYNQIASILKNFDDEEYQLYLYMNRGNTRIALGKFEDAHEDLLKATEIARRLNTNAELMYTYQFRAQLAEKMKDYKEALAYWKIADSIKQKVVTDDSRKHIQQLEVKYRTAQKDLSLSKQNIELIKKENAIKKKNAQNTALVTGCILLALVLVLLFRNLYQRKKLSVKERELHNQRIRELEKRHQFDAMQSILRAQEEERSRLAKDLHDGIGGLLSGVKLGLSGMQESQLVSSEDEERLEHVIRQLDKSITELRRVSHNMMPEALINFGLKEALENYCESLNLSGQIKVRLQTYGLESRMDNDEEISIYRIVQELLNNIIKHAAASNVLIQLTHEDQKFSLTVEDDGKGFDMDNINIRNSAGIINIQSRAEFLNGTVDFQTAPGEGTSVTIIGKCRA